MAAMALPTPFPFPHTPPHTGTTTASPRKATATHLHSQPPHALLSRQSPRPLAGPHTYPHLPHTSPHRYDDSESQEGRLEQRTDGMYVRYLPAPLLREVNIVDTPGTNVILDRQQRLTEEYVPRADLVLFVMSADRPFSESEVKFLEYIRQWKKKVWGMCGGRGDASSHSPAGCGGSVGGWGRVRAAHVGCRGRGEGDRAGRRRGRREERGARERGAVHMGGGVGEQAAGKL